MSKTEPSDRSRTDSPKCPEAGPNLFQSRFWAEHKGRFGWDSYGGATDSSYASVLFHRRLPGPFSLLYSPYGGASEETHLPPPAGFDLEAYVEELRRRVLQLPVRPTFLRWDLPFPIEDVRPLDLEAAGLVKAAADVQPATTVVLDLGKTEDDLLKGMKTKTRYNVRLATKRGVTIERTTSPEAIADWYALYRVTAERDRIAIHSEAYYRSLFELAENRVGPSLSLYLARHEGDLLAGVIVARYGTAAYYLYGASSNVKRNLMPAYALQWRAIQDCRSAGARSYDFFGIPPAENPSHPMHGLYRFKIGFGGSVVRRPGAYDLPLKRGSYRLFRLLERGRNRYYRVFRKRGG